MKDMVGSIEKLSDATLLRLPQIIGQRAVTEEQAEINRQKNKGPKRARPAIDPIYPVSKSTLWWKIQKNEFPKPIRLGPKSVAWTAQSVKMFLQQLANNQEQVITR